MNLTDCVTQKGVLRMTISIMSPQATTITLTQQPIASHGVKIKNKMNHDETLPPVSTLNPSVTFTMIMA